MPARMWLVITLLLAAVSLVGCATAVDTEVEATVAAELTRLAPTATPEPTATPQEIATPTLAELVARFRLSIAQIITPDGTGTGFLYDPAGLVATNAHVVGNRHQVTVVLNGVEHQGRVLNRNEDADLAVVKVSADTDFTAVPLGSAGRVALGEDVMALGFPLSSQLGDDLTVTRGIISARRQFEGYEYFQTDAALNPGNSGGPLLNHGGEVVGVITFGIAEAEGVAFALSVDELNSRLEVLSRVPPTATPRPTATPEPTLPPSERFVQLSSGLWHTCGVKADGMLVCWGSNTYARFDGAKFVGQARPPSGSFQQVSAGEAHTCGVKIDGRVACWGDNTYGQATPPAGIFQQVSTGQYYTCGLKTNDNVVCWGARSVLKVAGGVSVSEATSPVGTFVQLADGFNWHDTCGVATTGNLVCWPYQREDMPLKTHFRQVSMGQFHGCGIKPDESVACWGADRSTLIMKDRGRGRGGKATPPAGKFQQISAGEDATCGVTTNHRVVCWGDDYAAPPSPPGHFAQISVGFLHTCGVKTDGSVVCWGDNRSGQATPP